MGWKLVAKLIGDLAVAAAAAAARCRLDVVVSPEPPDCPQSEFFYLTGEQRFLTGWSLTKSRAVLMGFQFGGQFPLNI